MLLRLASGSESGHVCVRGWRAMVKEHVQEAVQGTSRRLRLAGSIHSLSSLPIDGRYSFPNGFS